MSGFEKMVQFDGQVTRAFLDVMRGEVSGETGQPELITGLNRVFSQDTVLGRIDRVLADLEPVHG